MTRDNKDQAKHISMELTADGARVTNLSLSGNRLVLTIEAELSDSQLRATDAVMTGRPTEVVVGDAGNDNTRTKSETEFLTRKPGESTSQHTVPGEPPADGAAAQSGQGVPPPPAEPHHDTDTERIALPADMAATLEEVARREADETKEPTPAKDGNSGGRSESKPGLADTQPIEMDDAPFEIAPIAPPLEPVRELTDTWDTTHDATTTDSIFNDNGMHTWTPLGDDAEPDISDSGDILGSNPPVSPEPLSITPTPSEVEASARTAKAEKTAKVESPEPETLEKNQLFGEITLGDDPTLASWGGVSAPPEPEYEGPRPVTETWDGSDFTFAEAPGVAEQAAISEESSAVGGDRHGEPQPAISFGENAAPAAPLAIPGFADAAPAPTPAPAAPIAPPPPPPAPPPLAVADVYPAEFRPEPEPMPAPPPAPPILPSPPLSDQTFDPMGMSDPIGFSPAPAFEDNAPPAFEPLPPPPPPAPVEKPEPPAEETSPAPAPETPKPAEPGNDGTSGASESAGSTTVLIRYTCPKCKTQGMQAVDKVGTVVKCATCGKAMRLVMKR